MTVRLCTCFWGDFKLYFFHSQVHMYTNMLINIWMTAPPPPPNAYTCACVASNHKQRGLREAISTAGGQVRDI